MRSIKFADDNVALAKDQSEYETLYVHVAYQDIPVKDPAGKVEMQPVPWQITACLELSKEEIDEINRTSRLWHTQCVFGQPFQPIMMSTCNPFQHIDLGYKRRVLNLGQIDDKSPEGKLLTAAIAHLTTKTYTDKTPDQVIAMLNELSASIYEK